MGGTSFDWRWIVLILVALIFFGQISFAPSAGLSVIILALGAYWALRAGFEPWRGRDAILGSRRVTYWRGQRIELRPARRARVRLAPMPLLVSVLYLLISAGLVLAALRLALRLFVR